MNSLKIYVGNLPISTTGQAVKDLFAKAGAVEKVDLIKDNFSGGSKGYAFVIMATEEEADDAIEMYNGFQFEGRELIVNESLPRADFVLEKRESEKLRRGGRGQSHPPGGARGKPRVGQGQQGRMGPSSRRSGYNR